jgi:hypothetical protein
MLIVNKESRQVRRRIERQEQRAKRAQETIEAETSLKIKKMLETVLSIENLQEIAKKTNFQKRKRKLTPMAIVGVLMLGCCNGSSEVPVSSLETMCNYLKKWFYIKLEKESLEKKINRKETAMFIKEVMMRVMNNEIDKILRKLLKKRPKIGLFNRILIQDSTVISLPETLAKIFRGCGGSASKAAVKCDFIIDQANHLVVKMKCIAGKVPDSKLSGDIIEHVQEGDLIIRDLGYFNLANFSKIALKKGYFLSRLLIGVNVYLNKNDEKPVNLAEHLEKIGVKNKGVDIDVYVGKNERLLVRLIGVKVPQEVIESRRQQYKKARGRSTEPSKELKEWHGYTLMITNITKKMASLQSILTLYKTRWQIELFFKNIKSILSVDKITGENKYRLLCLLFTKLCISWIASILYAYAQAIVSDGKEVSRFKFTRWLKDLGDLRTALRTKDFTTLLEELERDLDSLCKEKRKMKMVETEEIEEIIEYAKAI